MKQFEDVKTQKINVIRQQGVQGEHALKAQQWVQANASKFGEFSSNFHLIFYREESLWTTRLGNQRERSTSCKIS